MSIRKDLEDALADSQDAAATFQAEALRGAAAGIPEPVVSDILTEAQKHTDHAERVAGVLAELPPDTD